MSFFLSRIDTKVDHQLPEDSPLRGQVAIASARVAYQRSLGKFVGEAWESLEAQGATPQRPLWASTGTKNPAYSDTRYVVELIGPDVINTMPDHALRVRRPRPGCPHPRLRPRGVRTVEQERARWYVEV